MKLKYRFVIREVSGQHVAVAVGTDHEKFNGMVKLNATGAFIMEKLNEGSYSRRQLLDAMLDRYDVEEERAAQNLDSFLQILRQGNLLED
ncbi:MAG: PqqD family protein [Oscillospiraceae bacterium]|nr:PqqD family protein [Oscillospiraceae bacterium]